MPWASLGKLSKEWQILQRVSNNLIVDAIFKVQSPRVTWLPKAITFHLTDLIKKKKKKGVKAPHSLP